MWVEIKRNMNKYYKILWLLPILYGIFIVINYGVNVIFWDEWELVTLYDNVEQNGLFSISTLKMLFSQHNEHRMFFPGFIMLISHKLTHFNSKICMLLVQIMVFAVYGTFVKYIIKNSNNYSNSSNKTIMTLFILMIGLACFSSIQWENFLWGFQVAFYMAIFGSVISLYFFHQYIVLRENKYCFLSLLFGIIASFSHMHGIIIWPIIIILILGLIFSGERSIIRKNYIYILIGTICYSIYFYNWNHPLSHPDYIFNVYKIIKFLFGSVGGMYTGRYSKLTVVFGGITVLLSIVLIIVFYIKKDIKSILFPVGLIGYSYAALLSIAIGRSGFGVEGSNASRYMSFSVLSYIGIIMIVYQSFVFGSEIINMNITMKYIKKVSIVFLAIFSILLIWGNIKGISRSRANFNFRDENVYILKDYEQQPIEKLVRLYPFSNFEHAYSLINKLKEYKLNVFSNSLYNNFIDNITNYKISIPKDVSEVLQYNIDLIDIFDNLLILHCSINDPQIIFRFDNKIKKPVGIPYIEIECANSVKGVIQLFYDYGDGFNEENSISNVIDEIKEVKKLQCPIIGWEPDSYLKSIRIDPPDASIFSIKNLEILFVE